MTRIQDLNGFSLPLTPGGTSAVVGDMPWYYGTEYLTIAYRAEPGRIAKYLPEPLEPGPDPDLAYVAFSKWWSLWDNQSDMGFTNPERTQYREFAIWLSCSYQGVPGQTCAHIWVDNDFTMARGWFTGFPKKFGQSYMTENHPLNPMTRPMGAGTKLKGIGSAHGERLIEGAIDVQRQITPKELPAPHGLPIYNIRQFPSVERDAAPSVLELVKLGAEDVRFGEVWTGKGSIKFFPSETEEHMLLAPREVLDAYRYSSGYTFPGGKVIHRWQK